ncbi:hypothetical protein COT23_01410 [Candidatus Kaiserbacteria bacterium CG08_land_8_20_14_0_20_50_21]|uniref:Uncharacterized protein n=1 Tax=Candidatus Kaiserbacteria bacterium CG08_land_8_20_14_0_20_50_21 TaxID=1974604 RepID=A0A2H0YY72_9BACT|nr:MAG: hypothetical protein COT23_01410 [Candidatus Kaiserbacteria bacterium CG08_land_8_20_14_0_20_50_21]
MAANPADIIARANLYLGRTAPALDHVLRLLKQDLPGTITYVNTNFDRGLPAVKQWDYAKARMEDDAFPAIMVSTAKQTVEFGAGHMDTHNVVVWVVYERTESRKQIRESVDIAELATAVLHYYKDAQTDPDGRVVWNDFLPTGLSPIPPDFSNYSGYAAHFQMRQTPGCGLWWTE